MPAVAKTTDLDVIEAARRIIDESGLDELSMNAIAEAVGIRAPSLYKRFADRSSIVSEVVTVEFKELRKDIDMAVHDVSPGEAIRAIAGVHWNVSTKRPHIYALLFSSHANFGPEQIAARTDAMTPIFTACRSLVGGGVALAAARTLTSYIHGFISMQLSGAFAQSGGVEGSYYYGLNAILKGVEPERS